MKINPITGARIKDFIPHARAFACGAAFVLVLLIPFLIKSANDTKSFAQNAKIQFSESVVKTADQLMSMGRRMEYAGADIKGGMLEDIKKYVFSLKEINDACARAFGSDSAPMDEAFLLHLMHSVIQLEQCYQAGENAEEYEKITADYLKRLDKFLLFET